MIKEERGWWKKGGRWRETRKGEREMMEDENREREREMMEGKMGKMTAEEINDGRRRRGRKVAEEIRKKEAGK